MSIGAGKFSMKSPPEGSINDTEGDSFDNRLSLHPSAAFHHWRTSLPYFGIFSLHVTSLFVVLKVVRKGIDMLCRYYLIYKDITTYLKNDKT